jgi:hypothetical protein
VRELLIKLWTDTWVLLIPVIAVAGFFPIFWLVTWITGNNTVGAIVAAVCMYLGLPIFLLNRWSPGFKVSSGRGQCLVEVTQTEIFVTEPNGLTSRMKIEEIAEISIVTDDSAPWNEDVWWVIAHQAGHSLLYPNGAIGEQDELERFNKLPNFDDKTVITAMGSTSVARFVCWKR